MGRGRQVYGVQITGLSNKIGAGHRHHHTALHQSAVPEGVDGEGHDVGFERGLARAALAAPRGSPGGPRLPLFATDDGYVHGTWDRSDISYQRPRAIPQL
jgi:hypothetical protein